MSPKNAWMTFSMLVVLGVVIAMAAFLEAGYPEMFVLGIGPVSVLVYFYVLYKRYNVEVVPESDIALFMDIDDLRILCGIYGISDGGSEEDLRGRLVAFSRANRSRPFTWVAPRLVRTVGEALEVPEPVGEEDAGTRPRPLTGGRTRSDSRLKSIDLCPICDTKLPRRGNVCDECGADLEFYVVLKESKVGRLLVSKKAVVARRKLRYKVPTFGGPR